MQLLSKQVVNQKVAQQKKAQIDEGIAIARKVDALRKTLSDLEVQHRNFIDGIKRTADIETKDLMQRIADLKAELKDLQESRQKALVPLDEAWANVRRKEAEVNEVFLSTEADRQRITTAKTAATDKLNQAKDILGRVKIRERELIKVYTEADSNRESAETAKKEAELLLDTTNKSVEKRLKDIAIKEVAAKNYEEANENYRQILDARNLELNDKETLLEDRMRAFEVEFNRFNQQKNG